MVVEVIVWAGVLVMVMLLLVGLSHQIRVPDLGELGTQMDRAMRSGAPCSESLRAKAQAMRAKVVAQMLGESEQRTGQMSLAVTLLGVGYLVMLLFPALTGVLNQL